MTTYPDDQDARSFGGGVVYLDPLLSIPAAIADTNGASIPGSYLTVADGTIPQFTSASTGPLYVRLPSGRIRTLQPTPLQQGGSLFAPLAQARPGNQVAFLGDSITCGYTSEAGIGGNTGTVIGSAWPTFASALSDQRVGYVINAGVFGNTTTQMITRFSTDVAAYSPNVVTILGGTNDGAPSGIGSAWSNSGYATWQANIKTLVGLIRGIGAVPVLCTMTPRTDTAGARQGVATWNKWLRRYAAFNGIMLLDFYRQAVDPTTGGWLASYGSTDNLHPNPAGAALLGQYAANSLSSLFTLGGRELLVTGNDTDDVFGSTGLFTGAVTGGLASGWSSGAAPTGATFSVVTDSAVPGSMQRIAVAATASDTYYHQGTSLAGASSAVGDVLAVSAVVTNVNTGVRGTSTTNSGELSKVRLSFGPGGTIDVYASSADVTRARVYKEITIPASSNQIDVQIHRDAGNGTFDVGQLTVVNLTRLGIVTP